MRSYERVVAASWGKSALARSAMGRILVTRIRGNSVDQDNP